MPFYTPQSPPPGFPPVVVGRRQPGALPLSSFVVAALAPRGILLPRNLTYMNIGPIRNKGVELSIDHTFEQQLERLCQLLVAGGAGAAGPRGQPGALPDRRDLPAARPTG